MYLEEPKEVKGMELTLEEEPRGEGWERVESQVSFTLCFTGTEAGNLTPRGAAESDP